MTIPGRRHFAEVNHASRFPHHIVFCLVFFVSILAAVVVPNEARGDDVQALVERARAVAGLEVEGGAPFRLEAQVYARVGGGLAAGDYVRIWQSNHRWRDELTFPGYSQVRVGTESAIWRRRNTNHQPLHVVQFLQGLTPDLPRNPGVGWKLTIVPGLELINPPKCVELEPSDAKLQEFVRRQWCFDADSGVPTRLDRNDWSTTWEYLEYTAWKGKQYPRQINITQDGVRVLKTRLTVRDAPNLDLASFAVPEGAEEWPRCEDVKGPTLTSAISVVLGDKRGARRIPTPVMIEVGADGNVQDVVFLRPWQDAERQHRLFVDLKQRWKFQPATCGKVAIPFTLIAEFPL